jgi:cytochrome c oxidase assembly protein subunit 15
MNQVLPVLLAEVASGEAREVSLVPIVLLFTLGPAAVLVLTRLISATHLALGFGATTAMWAIGYVSMMAPGFWIGEALFVATLAVPVAAGALARRAGATPVKVGLVCAFANLLVLGAFLRGDKGGSQWMPALYVAGLFVASAGLAALGGVLARRAKPISIASPVGLFAGVCAATVFILLVTGGLVTGLESGLAVPDWPNSFGHNMLLYPVSEMKGGIYYEHAHRLFGMLVGTAALVFTGLVFRDERRGWVRALACAFLAMVCVQGLLGGLRVTGRLTTATSGLELQPSTLLAIVHGMFGQIVLATACVLAVVTSAGFARVTPVSAGPAASRLRALPLVLVVALLAQLFLGASYRHLQIPPQDGVAAQHPAWAIWGHIFGALVVLILAVATGATASSRARACAPLRILGKGLVHAVGLQVALGIGALVVVLMRVDSAIPLYEVVATSAHQALGAVLLAMTAMLAAWSLRAVPAEAPAPLVTPSSSTA